MAEYFLLVAVKLKKVPQFRGRPDAPGHPGLFQGLQVARHPFLLAVKSLAGFFQAPRSGLWLALAGSSGLGHGQFLQCVISRQSSRARDHGSRR
jgi:hypothetical protein